MTASLELALGEVPGCAPDLKRLTRVAEQLADADSWLWLMSY